MREARIAQISIFDQYSEHQHGEELKLLSDELDRHPVVLSILADDLIDKTSENIGRIGMPIESALRCMLLKQMIQVSYEKLAFHLSDSMTYRTFTRLPEGIYPCRASLQENIRAITPESLAKAFQALNVSWLNSGELSLDQIRSDSTPVKSNILSPPSDSQLLNDSIRVLSRMLAKSRDITGVKINFVDQRSKAKSLAAKIFYAKNEGEKGKEAMYPDLLSIAEVVLKQVNRFLPIMETLKGTEKWVGEVKHYKELFCHVIDQTQRRIFNDEEVPASEKIFSIFEPHTDIISKKNRDTVFGHKINLSTDKSGIITQLSIEDGNPADSEKFLPILQEHKETYGCLPHTTACDGGYASIENVEKGREAGVKRAVFHKQRGISLRQMGVVGKTFKQLRNFRAGVEANISELKRVYGLRLVTWKGLDGFEAYVWASAICYNLVKVVRNKA